MRKFLNIILGITLFNLAIVLYWFLSFINFLLVRSPEYFLSTAVAVDKYGNRDLRTLWNHTLIKSDSPHKFGHPDETISSVLGKNKLSGHLTRTGVILAMILDMIDKDHCIKSITYN